jgi:TPR repeat protein/serine/threonine protein kinase
MATSDPDPMLAIAEARIGAILKGKYRLERVLGMGGMAAVYKATHRNQAEFALKMLHPQLSLHEDVRTRFLREGYAANSVKHPGVVLIVDDDVTDDGVAFLVMELLRGCPVEMLRDAAGGRLPVQAILSVGEQLLDVLAAAHEKGIVHRDVKPENLFVTTDGTLKVLDFGIARVREATAGGSRGTKTGALLGTPAYMAPEQAYGRGHEIDGQTDVWAVGATLFMLLSGESVHVGETAAELLIHAATNHARSLASVAPDVPQHLAQIVDGALAFEKGARWPSAAAMRDALRELSLSLYGEAPNRAHLAPLVQAGLPANLDVVSAPTHVAPSRHAGSSMGPPAFLSAARPSGSGLRSSPDHAASTPSLPAPRKTPWAKIALIAAVGLIVIVGAAYTMRRALRGTGRSAETDDPVALKGNLADGAADATCQADGGGDCAGRCAKGELKACSVLAGLYAAGTGVPKDDARAIALYQKACEGGEASACAGLGFMVKTGVGAARDEARALTLFQKACEGGSPLGCGGLGQMSEGGLGGLAKDDVQAVTLYTQGCDGKDPASCANLGHMYMRGRGVSRDEAKALPLVKQGCDAGIAFWCANLGILLARGKGVPNDDAQAFALFDRACSGGALLGCTELAVAYQAGRGVPKDTARAAALFDTACKGGSSGSCISLADDYAKGDGVPKDPGQSVAILTKSCDANALASCAALGKHYADGVGVTRNPARAVELFDKACPNKRGEPWCAVYGYVFERDHKMKPAINHYRSGCEREDEWCCAQLKRLGEKP